ncbi:hypothetical protein [Kitasatospora sp. NPDC098663]|uniref:hypothetical protein n=1 Tax=Kitasatospora sp. NPDC098663 TaxID=3364096 RepID=UPI0037F65125
MDGNHVIQDLDGGVRAKSAFRQRSRSGVGGADRRRDPPRGPNRARSTRRQ